MLALPGRGRMVSSVMLVAGRYGRKWANRIDDHQRETVKIRFACRCGGLLQPSLTLRFEPALFGAVELPATDDVATFSGRLREGRKSF